MATVPDALDIEQHDALLAYLRTAGHIGERESPRFETLPGGVSSRTVLVGRPDGREWVLKQSLPRLRVAVDWYSDPRRIHREALGMRWLRELAPPASIPALLFEDRAQRLIAMEAVPRPHANWKTVLLSGGLDLRHVRQFGHLLATIHRRSAERRSEVFDVFEDRTFFETLRVEPYYSYTASQVPAASSFLTDLAAAVRARRLAIVHGDYSPKNILLHDGRLILLDHEVIHFGDPAFDLGFSLAHFLSKAHHLTAERDAFASAAATYWRVYREELGGPGWAAHLEEQAVRNTLGCLLARVDGRSPLEYLTSAERARQRDVVVDLMRDTPVTIDQLVRRFTSAL